MKTILPYFYFIALMLCVPTFAQEINLNTYMSLNSADTYRLGFSSNHKVFSAAFYAEKKGLADTAGNLSLDKSYFFDDWFLKNAYFKIPSKTIDVSFGSLSYSGMLNSFKTPHYSSLSSYSASKISSSHVQAYAPSFTSSAQAFSLFFQYKDFFPKQAQISKYFSPKLSFIATDLAPLRYLNSDEMENHTEIIFSHLLLPFEKNKQKYHLGLGYASYYQKEGSETTWFLSKPKRNEGFYSILGFDASFQSPYISAKNQALFSQVDKNEWRYANRSEVFIRLAIKSFEASLFSRFFLSEPRFINANANVEKTGLQAMLKPQVSIKKISLPFLGLATMEWGFLGEYEKKTLSLFPLKEEEASKMQTSFSIKTLSTSLLYAASIEGAFDSSTYKNEGNQNTFATKLPYFFKSESTELKQEGSLGYSFFLQEIKLFSKHFSHLSISFYTSFSHSSLPFASEKKAKLNLSEKLTLKIDRLSLEEKISLTYKEKELENIKTKTSLAFSNCKLNLETEYKIPSLTELWLFSISYKTAF